MASIYLTSVQKNLLWGHLLPTSHKVEEGAFLLVRQDTVVQNRLICEEVLLLGPEDLAVQLHNHIELADDVRPRLIKKAHDTGLILVEMHSHLGNYPACFSRSDLWGFEEWVPPYALAAQGTGICSNSGRTRQFRWFPLAGWATGTALNHRSRGTGRDDRDGFV